MTQEEYIIINKIALEKRIQDLENMYETITKAGLSVDFVPIEIETIKKILSQSTPLIPVVEEAIKYGLLEGSGGELCEIKDEVVEHQQCYISNLKLNI